MTKNLPFYTELTKELILKCGVAQMRLWFLGAHSEFRAQELNAISQGLDSLRQLGDPSLTDEDIDAITELFATFDPIYWAYSLTCDPDLLLDAALKDWVDYLEAKAAPKGTTNYQWDTLEEDYGEFFAVINQFMKPGKIHGPTGKELILGKGSKIDDLRLMLRDDYVPIGLHYREFDEVYYAARLYIYLINRRQYDHALEVFRLDDLWPNTSVIHTMVNYYGDQFQTRYLEFEIK